MRKEKVAGLSSKIPSCNSHYRPDLNPQLKKSGNSFPKLPKFAKNKDLEEPLFLKYDWMEEPRIFHTTKMWNFLGKSAIHSTVRT